MSAEERIRRARAGTDDHKIASWRSSAENERRYSERACFLVATTDDEMVAIFRALDERDVLKAKADYFANERDTVVRNNEELRKRVAELEEERGRWQHTIPDEI